MAQLFPVKIRPPFSDMLLFPGTQYRRTGSFWASRGDPLFRNHLGYGSWAITLDSFCLFFWYKFVG